MLLPPGEPEAGPWRVVPYAELPALLGTTGPRPAGRPWVVAVDGRSAAGKSTLAALLTELVPRSAVVHTDDLAWHEPLYGWAHLLEEVLRPLRDGRSVALRPQAWEQHGRDGLIEVDADVDLVVVEGTGADHRDLHDLLDATVWIQSDAAEAERRGIARDIASGVNGDEAAATAFWHDWARAEAAFFAEQRTWARATLVVRGTPSPGLSLGHLEVASPVGP